MSKSEEDHSQSCASGLREEDIDAPFEERIAHLFREKTKNIYFTPTMRERFMQRLTLQRKAHYDKIS